MRGGRSKWRGIQEAGEAGRGMGQAVAGIGEGIYRAFNEGKSPDQVLGQTMQNEAMQKEMRNKLLLESIFNRDKGIVPVQPGQTMDGIEPVGVEGFGFSEALREKERKKILEDSIALARERAAFAQPSYQFIPGANGEGYSFNRRAGVAEPTRLLGTENTLKVPEGITLKDIAINGEIRRVGINKEGKVAMDYGLAPVGVNTINDAQGNVVATPSQAIPGQSITATHVNAPQQPPVAGAPVGAPTEPERLKVRTPGMENAKGLRDDIQQDKAIKDFNIIDGQFELMTQTMNESEKTNNFLAADQALINIFNKMIAPDSVVMPSEYARTSGDQALINRVKGYADKVMSGGVGLQPGDRQALYGLSQKFHEAWQKRYNERADIFKDIAKRNNIDVRDLGLSERGQKPKGSLHENETAVMIGNQLKAGVITKAQARQMLEDLNKKK